MALNSTRELLDDIRDGRMVVVMDDEDRENEGDLVMAASKVRPEDIQLHGALRPRADLPAADAGTLPTASTATDGQ